MHAGIIERILAPHSEETRGLPINPITETLHLAGVLAAREFAILLTILNDSLCQPLRHSRSQCKQFQWCAVQVGAY